ncbi:MAG: DNA repair protein RadC [Bacillota bacterium]|nr:DNA repair protein RadC [Bacillota bacterium]
MSGLPLRALPPGERPRERLLAEGAAALTDAELLAILFRTGNANGRESALELARRLLARAGERPPLAWLAEASVEELCQVAGIGLTKAVTVRAALELGRRVGEGRALGEVIRGPRDVARFLMGRMAGLPQEEFRTVLLNTRHRVIGLERVSLGDLDSSPAAPREVFREPVRRGAAAVVLAHNHPSGDPEPSPDDLAVTSRLVEAGRLLGIDVLDHIIIGHNGYVSLRERGVAF